MVVVVALMAGAAHLGSAQAPPKVSFRVVETDPSARTTLDGGQAVYLRIAYESDVPLRFRAKAYNEGGSNEVSGASNPKPAYPAGQGEALAWLAFDDAVHIDQIRVTALDEQWREVAAEHFAIDMRWNGVMPRRQRKPAAWARHLNDAQQLMSMNAQQAAADQGGIAGDILVAMMGWAIPAYLILQGYMLLRFHGGWRRAAMVPLVGMVPLVLFTLFGFFVGANLWPLMLLFLTPIAFGYLIVLWMIKSLWGRQIQYASNP